MPETILPQIPDVPGDASIKQRDFLQTLKEIIEVRNGRRGNSLDRFITLREFQDLLNGNIGIGVSPPTAVLHLKACTAEAGTASLKIDPGTVATDAVSGNIESDGVSLWWTDATGVRKQLDN